MLTRSRQVWCVCSIKIVRGELLTMGAILIYAPLPFTVLLFTYMFAYMFIVQYNNIIYC